MMFENNSFFIYKKPDNTKLKLAAIARKQAAITARIVSLENNDATTQLKETTSLLNQKLITLQKNTEETSEKIHSDLLQIQSNMQEQIASLTENLIMNEKKIERLIIQGTDLSKKINALFKSFIITKENVSNLYTQIRLLLRIKR